MGRTKTKQSKSTSRSDSTSAPASSSLTLYAVVALTAVVVGVLFNAQIAHVLRQLSGTTAASLAPEKAEAAAPAAAPGTVLEVFEHDATAFTQGLFVHNGSLYESTGLYGASVIRRVDPATGAVLAQTPLDKSLFGEGSVAVGDKIMMLTWKERVVLTFDASTLSLLSTERFSTTTGEGWGITHDGTRLIVSDGSAYLHFWDMDALPRIRETRPPQLVVDEDGAPVKHLNELEFIDGAVYANVWYKNFILRIDPDSGRTTGRLNLDGLIAPYVNGRRVDCLNGIAWNASQPDSIFVTGKWWPKAFRVAL